FAIAASVDPFSDRITCARRLDLAGPIASVREDAAQRVEVSHDYICGIRRNGEFQWPECDHHERHTGGAAAGMVDGVAVPAIGVVRHAFLKNGLVLGSKRSL